MRLQPSGILYLMGLSSFWYQYNAWSMLTPNEGRLVALTPTSFTWNTAAACRRLSSLVCRYRDDSPTFYPAGRFQESGTPVKTMLLPLVKRDLSWQDHPYEGYPDWHCAILDFFLNQTRRLSEQRQAIWQRLDGGELPDDPGQPGWENTRMLLAALFAQAVEEARQAWIEIRLDEREQQLMERVFLAHGLAEYQCKRHTALRQQGFNEAHSEPFLPDSRVLSSAGKSSALLPENAKMNASIALSSLPLPDACVQLALFPA